MKQQLKHSKDVKPVLVKSSNIDKYKSDISTNEKLTIEFNLESK